MITKKDIENKIDDSGFTVFQTIGKSAFTIKVTKILIALSILAFMFLFLPWTQNTEGYGKITTINAQERPQALNAAIDGRVKKWYVTEGESVELGDTLLRIEEIKDYYLDTQLIDRTRALVEIKKNSIVSYESKVNALNELIQTLKDNRVVKLAQAKNKLESNLLKYKNDSAYYSASQEAFEVAEQQFERAKEMKEKGMIAQYQFENRSVKFQQTKAKLIEAFNKTQVAQNNIEIARNDLSNISNTFNEKIAKGESDLYSAEIALLTSRNELIKQENSLANLIARSGMYYITAPQGGFVSQTNSSGIGEVVKKGQQIVEIVPDNQHLAAEIFVKPIDIPLLSKGVEVRLVFDGWPSIVFSGWPGASVGTFSAEIFSIDKNISDNGKYRVLVAQTEEQPWPELLRVGSGVHAYVLLNDVPIWFELWRQLNGFPANFYKVEKKNEGYKKK